VQRGVNFIAELSSRNTQKWTQRAATGNENLWNGYSAVISRAGFANTFLFGFTDLH
jgi:hypothetical protein